MLKILLFGASGQVGWELQRALAPLGELVALDRRGWVGAAQQDGLCGDLSDANGLRDTMRRVRPDVIVNAAAYTAVDRAEAERDLAQDVNGAAPAVMAEVAATLDALLVHYSTDYVFDGSGTTPWRESDAPAPLNEYGRTKLAGEQAILQSRCRHLLLRTSWVYGTRGSNFARTMLRLASEREHLRVVADQVGAPTGAELIADITAVAVRETLAHPERAGLYHLAAGGETSWCGFAQRVIDRAHARSWPLATRRAEAITTADYPTPTPRPGNSRLDTTRLRDAFGCRLPDWTLGVDRVVDELTETTT